MHRIVVLMLAPCSILCVVASLLSADDLPPGVRNTQNAADISLLPQQSLQRITVPEGFHVTLFAGEPDIRRPIAFDFDDRGRLWVVENYSHPEWREDGASDRIVILEDTNHDGRFDRRKVFWDQGRYLTGIALGHGGVWIANTPELAFIPDRNHDDLPDAPPVAMLDGFAISSNNVLNNLHWGPDGWLYGAIGLSNRSLVGRPGAAAANRTQITRGIWRYHPLRRSFEVVAEGMVNPWGADFNAYGDLFTANTVIAHLWHIVPGMYCQRRGVEQDYLYAYGRIQSIADHLHWGGGNWTSSRTAEHRHSVAGGGHAHCGGMVYLGDNWPEAYRGAFFTANLHGNRVNQDRLIPHLSTYVGIHSDDFLFGHDPWFRGLSVKYGPDGGVYVSDWHDLGECHDTDGSHRSSGRIFKVVYGQPEKHSIDLQRLSCLELANLHTHRNAWFARHARRLLQERAARAKDAAVAKNAALEKDLHAATQHLRRLFQTEPDERQKLRALWTLFVMQALPPQECIALLQHESLHVRRWAVRFLVDKKDPSAAALAKMEALARDEPTAKVRLALACTLQRIPLAQRAPLAQALLSHAEDANDPYLPLMIWYGVEPLAAPNREAALEWASQAKIPLVRRYIARRILDEASPPVGLVIQEALRRPNDNIRFDLLQGMFDALEERGSYSAPQQWPLLDAQIASSSHAELRALAVRLAMIFGDKKAIADLRGVVLDGRASSEKRRAALQALLKIDGGLPLPTLHALLTEPADLRRDVIQALALRNNSSTADKLFALYAGLNAAERQDAISVFCSRRDFAVRLLRAIEQGKIPRRDVSAFALQQLRAFHDESLGKKIAQLWAGDVQTFRKAAEIARRKNRLTPEFLAHGDAEAGRTLFKNNCAKCHTLFGQGGNVGPNLTGSGRKDLDYLLSNLIDPSATVDPAYRLTTVLTDAGRLLSGFMVQHTEKFVLLRTQDALVRLPLDAIEELRTSNTSMMPEGLLRNFSDEQVRDLFVYLRSAGIRVSGK